MKEELRIAGYKGIAVTAVQVAIQDYVKALKDISAFESMDKVSANRYVAIQNEGRRKLKADPARCSTGDEALSEFMENYHSTAIYEAYQCEKFLREECEMLTGYDGEIFITECRRQIKEWKNAEY